MFSRNQPLRLVLAPTQLDDWREVERIATVLLSEESEQEAECTQQHSVPDKNTSLLLGGISYARHLHSQRDGAEGEHGICHCAQLATPHDHLAVPRTEHTNDSDNLRFHSKLVAESAGDVGDTALSVIGDIRNPSDVIKHVATGEEQNEDERDRRPQVARVERGLQRVEGEFENAKTEECSAATKSEVGVVERPQYFRVEVGVHRDPLGDTFGGNGAGTCQSHTDAGKDESCTSA